MSGSYSDLPGYGTQRILNEYLPGSLITGSSRGVVDYYPMPPNTNDIAKQVFDMMYGHYAPDVILKCQHCGQWGALGCPCKQCGGPIR